MQINSIMSESTDYRPKIFHSSGALMGAEEVFPEPNVPYKSHFDHHLCCQDAQPKLNYHHHNHHGHGHGQHGKPLLLSLLVFPPFPFVMVSLLLLQLLAPLFGVFRVKFLLCVSV